MILKGSQRSGARQLAAHLLNSKDNDHVTVHELRGFVANDVQGAMAEAEAIAKGTRCRQPIFSLSLNPPKDGDASLEALLAAVDEAENRLGLSGQPRAIVIHEKLGRRHAHAVWSRIAPDAMKAINLPHFKRRLCALSKDLFLKHGWELPRGHRQNDWKNPLNFTLEEWQQAKRLEMDPAEIKQVLHEAWYRSDGLPALRHALESNGYFLAKGDRRGFVALNIQGEVFALARWAGLKAKELEMRLGPPDGLPSVAAVKEDLRKRMDGVLRTSLAEQRKRRHAELSPLNAERAAMVEYHRAERDRFERLQRQREKHEAKTRASKFRRGFGTVLDILTGRLFSLRRENEREAYAALMRDRAQREALVKAQLRERQELQQRTDTLRRQHRAARLKQTRQIASVLARLRDSARKRHDTGRHL